MCFGRDIFIPLFMVIGGVCCVNVGDGAPLTDPDDLLLHVQRHGEGVHPAGLTPAQLLALLLPPQSQTQLLLQGLELQSGVGPRPDGRAQLSAELLESRRLLGHHLTEPARRVLQGQSSFYSIHDFILD